MDTVFVGVPYSEKVTIFVLADTTVVAPVVPYPTANARIDSVKITNWNNPSSLNLPSGLQSECNPAGCVFPGNSLGCIAVTGTVTNVEDTGSYLISASIVYYFTITNTVLSGYNYNVSGIIHPFTIEVKQAAEDSTITGAEKMMLSNIAVYPNPSNNIFHFKIEHDNTGQLLLQVFNAQGVEVFQQQEVNTVNNSTIVWNASELPSGIYFYVLHRDNKIERGKLLINK